jgi:hypothetical protein
VKVGEVRSDNELVEAVETLRQDRLNTRRPQEKIWWDNIAFYAGDHYSEWNSQQAKYYEPKKDPHQVRLVINQARVIARQEIAKITKSRPIMDVVPKSDDDVDIAAAKVGGFALEACEWKFNLRRKRRIAVRWMVLGGVAGMYVGYDPNNDTDGLMDFYIDPSTGEPTFNVARIEELKDMEAEGIEITKESWPLGDMEFKIYSPFQMLPDDTGQDWDEISDIIVTDTVEVEEAKDLWPKRASDIATDAASESGLFARVLRRAGLAESPGDMSEDTVSIHTYWLKPGVYNGRFLSKGKMLRWCNNRVILEAHEDFPFSDKRLPFAFFVHTPNPISIWPDTTIMDIRPINLELDKTISQLLENRDYMVNPMWRKAKQSQVAPIKSQPGGEISYVHVKDVPPPDQVPGIPLPTQIENLVVGLRDMVLDVSGAGEVSRGRVPSGVRAGNMLAFLQEQDETQLGPIIEDFEDSIATMGSLTLSRYSQFYSTKRLLRIYRPGGHSDVLKFRGADLKGNTDVMVQAGSALPKLKAAKQQYVIQLVEMGILKDQKRIEDWLELGGAEPDEVDLAFRQADRENDLMLRSAKGVLSKGEEGAFQPSMEAAAEPGAMEQMEELTAGYGGDGGEGLPSPEGAPEENGAPPTGGGSFAIPVKKWHIHEAHMARHRRVMMGPEFERLALTHPDVVRIFDEHVAMHEQAIQEQMMQQMQMMALAQGGPSETAPDAAAQPTANAAPVAMKGS